MSSWEDTSRPTPDTLEGPHSPAGGGSYQDAYIKTAARMVVLTNEPP